MRAFAAFARSLSAKYAAQASSGPFFFGAEPSLVDVIVLPLVLRFYVGLAFYRGFDLLPKARAIMTLGVLLVVLLVAGTCIPVLRLVVGVCRAGRLTSSAISLAH